MITHRAARLVPVAFLAAALACETATGPSREEVAGNYTATTFTSVTNGVSTDMLAAGASLSMVLASSGTTSGQLVIPDGNGDGSDLVESMAGTWTLSDNTVTFQQSADTFVRDTPFVLDDSTLVGDQIFGDTRVVVILTKQP